MNRVHKIGKVLRKWKGISQEASPSVVCGDLGEDIISLGDFTTQQACEVHHALCKVQTIQTCEHHFSGVEGGRTCGHVKKL